jgi:hypothetical protein
MPSTLTKVCCDKQHPATTKLYVATLLLVARKPMSCGAQISGGDKQQVGVGVPLEKAANYTILASRLTRFSSSLTSEVIAYIDERTNATAAFDFYSWSKLVSSNKIGVMAVCPTNSTDASECAAFAE